MSVARLPNRQLSETEQIKGSSMKKEGLTELAKLLKCAYLSYHMAIAPTYCLKAYVEDKPVEHYWYEMADLVWTDNHREPRKWFRVYTLEDWANLGGGLGPELVGRRNAFISQFGRTPTPDDPFFFDPTRAHPVAVSHEEILADFIENGKATGRTIHESLTKFYQIFRFPIEDVQ
jgi:hypothetical protein